MEMVDIKALIHLRGGLKSGSTGEVCVDFILKAQGVICLSAAFFYQQQSLQKKSNFLFQT